MTWTSTDCKRLLRNKQCRHGCRFVHDNNVKKAIIVRHNYSRSGYCQFGSLCLRLHDASSAAILDPPTRRAPSTPPDERGFLAGKRARVGSLCPSSAPASSSSDRTVTTPTFAERLDVLIRDRVRARFVLADNAGPTIEGNIIGRDDELNLVVDRAVELDILGRTSELGRIMLAGYAYSTFSVLFEIA